MEGGICLGLCPGDLYPDEMYLFSFKTALMILRLELMIVFLELKAWWKTGAKRREQGDHIGFKAHLRVVVEALGHLWVAVHHFLERSAMPVCFSAPLLFGDGVVAHPFYQFFLLYLATDGYDRVLLFCLTTRPDFRVNGREYLKEYSRLRSDAVFLKPLSKLAIKKTKKMKS